MESLNGNTILSKIQNIKGRKYNYKSRKELIQMHESGQIQFSVDTVELEEEKSNLLAGKPDSIAISDSLLKQNLGYDQILVRDDQQYGTRIDAPNLGNQKYYGVVAQEIKNEFPELVKFDSTSMLYGVNYKGFVPVLLEAIKAQQHKIDTNQKDISNDQSLLDQQEQRIKELEQLVQQQQEAISSLQAEVDRIKTQCCSSMVEQKSKPTGMKKINQTAQAELYQNIPNPFTESTRIEYFLPQSTGEARLYIYNMQGSQIRNYRISSFEEGSITIQGGSMQPGMYMYTLVADDRVVDTKQMILTK